MVDRRISTGWVAGFAGLAALAGFTAHGAIAARAGDAGSGAVAPRDPAPLDLSAPMRGVTGTTALPDLPASAGSAAVTGAQVAQPFHLRGSMTDRARALQCLTTAIYYEAASEPYAGQRAVAQVVLNRVRHPAFPATICGVVFQGSDKRGCQFSFACDGAMARVPVRRAWDRAQSIAAAALNGRVFSPAGLATHYHTYAVTPSWNRALVMTDVQGAHFFHRWKGWWGTAAAFQDRYAGGEPLPAPLRAVVPRTLAETAPTATASSAAIAPPAPAAPPVPRSLPDARFQPAYAESGSLRETAPAGSDILDKWKDSGQPIR